MICNYKEDNCLIQASKENIWQMVVFVVLFISGLYLLFNVSLWYGWRKIETVEHPLSPTTRATIIVVTRNEEANIAQLLADFDAQSYPSHLFEVIIVDDHSEDRTVEFVKQFQQRSTCSITLFSLPALSKAPKKAAIEVGVFEARGDLLLITDGDCRVKRNWVESMTRAHVVSGAKFIAGPVAFVRSQTFWQKLMTIEFASLVGAGAVSVAMRTPLMCNAANMAFEKEAFYNVEGFKGNETNASGDDIFLMRKIAVRYSGGVAFNKDRNAIVETYPEKSLKRFLYQRIRWAGKWRTAKGIVNQVVPLFVFVCHLTTLFTVVGVASGDIPLWTLPLVLIVKFAGEFLFLTDVLKFLERRISREYFLAASLIYPLYAFLMGVAANVSGYRWKGRRYD